MSITPVQIRHLFEQTRGTDPLFRTNDGSNSPLARVSTVNERRAAYSMLLTKGLIRVGLGVPSGAEFVLKAVNDPHGFASSNELSLFRRPLPGANLNFLTTVMWDGRESPAGRSPFDNLAAQAFDATIGHAQAALPPSAHQINQIVEFELSLFAAQAVDGRAGPLSIAGANGGVAPLARQPFYPFINDTLGADPTGAPFDPRAMRLYDMWNSLNRPDRDPVTAARMSVARGEALFNSRPISITGVNGLNDALGAPVIQGTCTTCHNTPNVGNHSSPLPIDIGVSDAQQPVLDTSGLPVYRLARVDAAGNETGEAVQTTDPGRALITGKWADIGKFKGPILRGLASRPPYFHNGGAATLGDVVDFYNVRFNIGLTAQERDDLAAFLRSL
jgi:hypothetical protein